MRASLLLNRNQRMAGMNRGRGLMSAGCSHPSSTTGMKDEGTLNCRRDMNFGTSCARLKVRVPFFGCVEETIMKYYEIWRRKGEEAEFNNFPKLSTLSETCELWYLDSVGSNFMWSGRRSKGETIWCQLDRICAFVGWMSNYSECQVYNKDEAFSDHHALVFHSKPKRGGANVAQEGWDKSSVQNCSLLDWISTVSTYLKHWNHEEFGHLTTKLRLQRESLNS